MLKTSNVWEPYNLFFSVPFVQEFLQRRYKKLNHTNPEQHSFKNCYPFIYYLEHSKNYYQLAMNSPISIQPVLLFYGLSQLLKACLLTYNPEYPANTAVLAHGVSTRKRKKQSYDFLDDEVKIQKNGLFSQVGRDLFHVKQLEGRKYTMVELLSNIPELHSLFSTLHTTRTPSITCIGNITSHDFTIPNCIKDNYHMTNERLGSYLIERFQTPVIVEETTPLLKIRFPKIKTDLYKCSPFLYHFTDETFSLSNSRDFCIYFPEVLSHYLLLYNLSMISRYETEWWYELLHTYSSRDYPYIMNFLELTGRKIPYLLFYYLKQ
ncbi:hypothetical protein FZC66_20340 [Priestia megaterium]|nr:hypothetical protein FZC66_20340 [Priestia megaterium]